MRRILPALAILASLNAAHAQDRDTVSQGQPVTSQAEVEASIGPEEYFTGRSHVRSLSSATPPGQAGLALVTFEPSARSNWHTHPAGQTIYVTEGCGLTQQEGGPIQRICAGDVVYAKPGVKHWHGADPQQRMTHLVVTETLDGKAVSWLEPVSDEQYYGESE